MPDDTLMDTPPPRELTQHELIGQMIALAVFDRERRRAEYADYRMAMRIGPEGYRPIAVPRPSAGFWCDMLHEITGIVRPLFWVLAFLWFMSTL